MSTLHASRSRQRRTEVDQIAAGFEAKVADEFNWMIAFLLEDKAT